MPTSRIASLPHTSRRRPTMARFAILGLLGFSGLMVLSPGAAVAAYSAQAAGVAQGSPESTGSPKSTASPKATAVAVQEPETTGSVQAPVAQAEDDLNCAKSRKRLWVEGEGWIVRRVTTCY